MFQLGQYVYFHNYVDSIDKKINFLCSGIIVRLPTETSDVYKITITSVNPFSVLVGYQPQLAQRLIGKTIPKKEKHLFTSVGEFGKQIYGLRTDIQKEKWIKIPDRYLYKITKKVSRLKEKLQDKI